MINTLNFTGSSFYLGKDDISADLIDALCDCGGQGDASGAVAYVRGNFTVTGNPKDCAAYLRAYGAWDDDELSNHDSNLDRLVWLAGCELSEENEICFDGDYR
jgi:hypothetical protein